jgi:hypothetical protein
MIRDQYQSAGQSIIQILAGMGLTTLPVWAQQLEGWLQLIVVLTGSILGVVGVYRLFFKHPPKHKDTEQ